MKRLMLLGLLLAVLVLPDVASAAPFSIVNNPDPKNTNLNSVVTVLVSVIKYLWAFAAAIAAIFVLVSGYQYILSAGNPEKIEKAKGGLTWAIVGFILVISSYAIVHLVQQTFRQKQATQVNNFIGPSSVGPQNAATVVEKLASGLFTFAGAAAVLFLVLGGYRYVTSRGNPDETEKAKLTILYSMIGLVVVFGSVIIFRLVGHAVGAESDYIWPVNLFR